MHRIKNSLCLILCMSVLLLVCNTGTVRAAYNPANGEAGGTRMKDLGLIKEVPGIGLGLDKEITRAELVTIIVRAFGKEQDAALLKGSSLFPDIANHWASGNIAMAAALVAKVSADSIAMPDGKFNPEGKLTPAQAIAFLMKFVGLKRDSTKAWPNDYLSAAVNANLISSSDADMIAPVLHSNATRGLVYYLYDSAFYSFDLGNGKTFYTQYVDTTPPELSVNQLPDFTTQDKLTVSGRASGFSELLIGTTKVDTNELGEFSYDYSLPELNKEYSIVVTARDLAGNKTEQIHKVSRGFTPAASESAAARMRDLGIISARADGEMGLSEQITRAELMALMVKAFGQEQNAAQLQGSAAYPDIANHWASGYIAMARALVEKAGGGAIGMPNGKFEPDAKLTPAEAVAFLMRFLGVKRDATKAWPQDYLSAAVNANLITTDDAALIAPMLHQSATRGLLFYLFDKAFYTYDLGGGKTFYTKYVDTVAPEVTVNSLPQSTMDERVTVSGKASGFTELYVGTTRITANEAGEFSYEFCLPELNREYSIVVTARDLAGNTTAVPSKIVRGTVNTILTVNPVDPYTRANKVTITGLAVGDFVELFVDGSAIPILNYRGEFTCDYELPECKEYTIPIKAIRYFPTIEESAVVKITRLPSIARVVNPSVIVSYGDVYAARVPATVTVADASGKQWQEPVKWDPFTITSIGSYRIRGTIRCSDIRPVLTMTVSSARHR